MVRGLFDMDLGNWNGDVSCDQEMPAKPILKLRLAVEAYYRTCWAEGAPVPDVQFL